MSPSIDALRKVHLLLMFCASHKQGLPIGNYGIFGSGARGSIRLDARELHHLAPLGGVRGDGLSENGGGAHKHRSPQVGNAGRFSWTLIVRSTVSSSRIAVSSPH